MNATTRKRIVAMREAGFDVAFHHTSGGHFSVAVARSGEKKPVFTITNPDLEAAVQMAATQIGLPTV